MRIYNEKVMKDEKALYNAYLRRSEEAKRFEREARTEGIGKVVIDGKEITIKELYEFQLFANFESGYDLYIIYANQAGKYRSISKNIKTIKLVF